MAQPELFTAEECGAQLGATITLGALSIEQVTYNWHQEQRHRALNAHTKVRQHTADIVEHMLAQLTQTPEVETATALSLVDRQLLSPNASTIARLHHIDACVDAVDLLLAVLRYQSHGIGGFIVYAPPDSDTVATTQNPIIQTNIVA